MNMSQKRLSEFPKKKWLSNSRLSELDAAAAAGPGAGKASAGTSWMATGRIHMAWGSDQRLGT